MNDSRKKEIGRFRLVINAPAAQAKTRKTFETRRLQSRCVPTVPGMITDGPSLNHSWIAL